MPHKGNWLYWLYFCIQCNKNGIMGLWGHKGPPSLGPGRKIYYCRPVRQGLWETFNNKPYGNVISTRLVGRLSVRALECSHKVCGTLFTKKVSKTKFKPFLWRHLLHMSLCILILLNGTLCVHLQLPKVNDDEW